ncbi:MAG: diaminopimelate decarboxylase [Bacteroidetes bacterium]|nr:diaminopimelate decarboxylase [Bacteroidota bacterium]
MFLDPSYNSLFAAYLKNPVQTPAYIYSNTKLVENISVFKNLFDKFGVTTHYAMKANSNSTILKLILKAGLKVDVNSLGELKKAMSAGFLPGDLIFAGVGKTDAELETAIQLGLKTIKAESIQELVVIGKIAENLGIPVRIGLRLNPEIDAKTHPYIATGIATSKFGIDKRDIPASIDILRSNKFLNLTTLDAHIGSQITDLNLFVDVFRFLSAQSDEFYKLGFKISDIDLGGGFAVDYDGSGNSTLPLLEDLFSQIAILNDKKFNISIEPGRAIVANSCAIFSTVLYTKRNGEKNFAICDAAMTENIRPSLYGSVHTIVKIVDEQYAQKSLYDVVGPVCESGDFLGENILLPELNRGDVIAILDSGAYTAAMASNYNMRPLSPEYLEKNGELIEIRRRQNINEWIENLEIPYEG